MGSKNKVVSECSMSKLKFYGIIFFKFFFLSFFMAVLGLHCCVQAFSSCSESGLLSSCGAWVSHCSGFSCCRAQALGYWEFSSCGQSDSDPFSHVGFFSLKLVWISHWFSSALKSHSSTLWCTSILICLSGYIPAPSIQKCISFI